MWKVKTARNVQCNQKDYAVSDGGLWKYILEHNFDEELIVMRPLGVQR